MSEQPWLKDKLWVNNEIVSFNGLQLLILVVFDIIWLGACILMFNKLDDLLAQAEKEPATWLFMLFPLTLVLMLFMTAKQFRQFFSIGKIPLSLDPYPGSIGGHVGGTFRCKIPFDDTLWARVKLQCVRTTITNNNKNSRRRDTVVWETDGICQINTCSDGAGSEMSFRFSVDDGLPPSDVERRKSYVLWRVELNIKDEINRLYEIPVFATQQESRLLKFSTEECTNTARYAGDELSKFALLNRGSNTHSIYFPAFKRPSGPLFLMIFGLVFLGAGIFIGYDDAPLLMSIIFVFIGAVLAFWGLKDLFKALYVEISAEEICAKRMYLGYSVASHNIAISDVRHVALVQKGTTYVGNKSTTTYELQAIGNSGNTIVLAERLNARSEANLVLKTIEELTGKQFQLKA